MAGHSGHSHGSNKVNHEQLTTVLSAAELHDAVTLQPAV